MVKSGIEIKGVEELLKKLKKLGEDVTKAKTEAMEKAAKIIQQDTVRRLQPYGIDPRWTKGRKAIRVERIPGKTPKETQVIVCVDPDFILYLPGSTTKLKWVEFGKPGYAPYPFLRISYDQNKQRIIGTIEEELRKTIMKAVK